MTCSVIVPCPRDRMTGLEARELAIPGYTPPPLRKPRGMSERQWLEVKKRWELEREKELAEPVVGATRSFLCGDFVAPACECGHVAGFLCDYPVGGGKTCDLALCGCCRESIGEDRDLCRIHAAQFRGTGRVVPRFSKPEIVT